MVRTTSRLSTTAVAAATALSLIFTCGAATAEPAATNTATNGGKENSGKKNSEKENSEKENSGKENGTKEDGRKNSELIPNVAPYTKPGLSSAPSSGQPGSTWHVRGLSSKIVDPIGGYKGLLLGFIITHFSLQFALMLVNITNQNRIAQGQQPLVIPRIDAGSSQAPGAEGSSQLSSQLSLSDLQLPPLPGR